MRVHKSQSAMEYLMTYGWAILIIVVAFSALYFLGVFGATASTGGALPGSCRVYKPYGTGTQQFIGLQGTCNSEQPRSVAQFSGGSSYVSVNNEYFQGGSFTILAWVYWPSGTNFAPSDLGYAWSGPAAVDQGFGMFSRSDEWYLNFYADDLACSIGQAQASGTSSGRAGTLPQSCRRYGLTALLLAAGRQPAVWLQIRRSS